MQRRPYTWGWACLLGACLLGIGGVFQPARLQGEQNWPELRGPTGQGIALAEGLPIEWSSTHNVQWKSSIPGKGWSSPLYENRRIYMTTAVPLGEGDEGNQSLRALCLEADTGKILWNFEVFHQDGETAPTIQSKNSHASATPVLHERKLYVHFGHQGTACLNLDGKLLWRTRQIQYAPRHGNGGSPIVVDDLLIFSCDGESDPFVVALDRNTGQERWRTARNIEAENPFSFCTPLLIQVNGRPLVISPGSEMVGAYEPQTGKEIWRVRYPGGFSVVPRPVAGHGLVFVSSGFMTAGVFAIRPDGEGDVTETHVAWSEERGAPRSASLLLSGDELYMVSDGGVARCVDARTGAAHWTERLGGNFSASPLLAGGAVYFQNETGTAYVAKASTQQFELLATNTLDDIPDERTFASYAVGDGALFLRSEKHLFRIETLQKN